MNLTLRPEVERMIVDQVKSGRFPSAEAMVEAAVTTLAQMDDELDDETIAAINEAEAQADRGEGTDLDTFRAEISNRFMGN
jgi:Arc/MetJ-type ribon-helix-helix transcriptional regulator